MFSGDTNLDPASSFGSPPVDSLNIPPDHGDFQIPFSSLLDQGGNALLFITGDHMRWGYMEYGAAFPLQAVPPFTSTSSPTGQGYGCGGNVLWTACQGDNIK